MVVAVQVVLAVILLGAGGNSSITEPITPQLDTKPQSKLQDPRPSDENRLLRVQDVYSYQRSKPEADLKLPDPKHGNGAALLGFHPKGHKFRSPARLHKSPKGPKLNSQRPPPRLRRQSPKAARHCW